MKELLTLKEAASLAGKTTKTIKNYIKRGVIKNFFMVEGKYGQEYRINVKDIEPLMKDGGKSTGGKKRGPTSGKDPYTIDIERQADNKDTLEEIYDRPEYQFVLRRNDEVLMDLGRCQDKVEKLERTILRLRQELEEKNMLISMLTKKMPSS
jgi:hypothetical protein